MQDVKLLILRLTERCNLRCAYCYAAREDVKKIDMDVDTALHAVELCCPPGGALRIQFTGGEPLLCLDIMEAVAAYGRMSGRRLTISVQTNATLLSPDVCQRLRALRCGVGVSLDGIGEANALRTFPDGTNSFDAAIQGVQNLGAAGLRCGLTAVVTRVNADVLSQLADLALALGNVAGVGLDLFRPLGRGKDAPLSAAPDALARGVRALAARADALRAAGIPFHFRELERLRTRRAQPTCDSAYCFAQTGTSFALDARGDWWPCSSLAGREGLCLGNLKDGLPQKTDAIATLAAPARCQHCETYPTCLGGCPAGRTARNAPDALACVLHRALEERREPI